MANILPSETRRDIRRATLARLALALSMLMIICALLTYVIFLPSYIGLVSAPHAASPSATSITKEQQTLDTAVVRHVNSLLTAIGPGIMASSTPVDIIESALAARPAGVHVVQIMYSNGTPSSLVLSGTSDTDTGINDYRAALAANPQFASVTVPVGALVGTDNGRFSITITGTF